MTGISFLCVDSAILQVFEDYYGFKADLSNDRFIAWKRRRWALQVESVFDEVRSIRSRYGHGFLAEKLSWVLAYL